MFPSSGLSLKLGIMDILNSVDTSSASIEPLGCDLSPNIQASRLHFRTEKSQG